ncbi:hypothetical protein [Haloarchaeobius sp. TZWSO28]|uniref:hypothetical protein n=1 Tax=Haloarchaeobius sp. TZWSO28 TaxID=3446119 RepID=UPI003EB94DCF
MTPTHVVVLGWFEDRTADEREAANTVVRATLEAGDAVRVVLQDEDGLRADHPDVFDRFRTEFTSPGSESARREYRGNLPDCAAALDALLDLKTWHRFVTLDTLVVETAGETILRYVPDHSDMVIWGESVAEHVAGALAGHPAAVLPADRIEWRDGETTVALDPPSLCVGNACFSLSHLEGTTIDHETDELVLKWPESRGLLGKALDSLGPDRPTRLALPPDDPSREHIETVVDRFGVLLSDGP